MPKPPTNLKKSLENIHEQWTPKVVAQLNDMMFKLAKVEGEFVWHTHDDTDEAFLVVKGTLEVGFRERTVTVKEGELFVVPRGVEHITRASEECHILIIEPKGIVNTGEAGGEQTAPVDDWI